MSNLLIDILKVSFKSHGILIRLKFNENWNRIFENEKYCPVIYSNSFIEYQSAYFEELGWTDSSIELFNIVDNKPIGLWPICYRLENSKIIIGTSGGSLIGPMILDNFDYLTTKNHYKNCLSSIFELIDNGIIQVYGFINYSYLNQSLSNWQILLEYSKGLKIKNLQYESIINLELSLVELKSRIRKSYKGLINKGLKQWNIVDVVENQDIVFSQFRNLHFQVALRKTRNDKSWEIQLNNLKSGFAKLLAAYDTDNKLVGAAYFDITKDEANYSVGVYDRKLFDLPIGHAIQWRAIEIFKRIGIVKYKVGSIYKISDMPKPSEKEISISKFKIGFGGELYSIVNI